MDSEIQKPDIWAAESVVRTARVAEIAASLMVPQIGVYSGLASCWFRNDSVEARITESVRFAAGLVPFFGSFLDLADAAGGAIWNRSLTGKEMGTGTTWIAGVAGLLGLALDLRGVGYFFRIGGHASFRSAISVTACMALKGLLQKEGQAVTRAAAEQAVRGAIAGRYRGKNLPSSVIEKSVSRSLRCLDRKDPKAAIAAAIRRHSIQGAALESGPVAAVGPLGFAIRPGVFTDGFWGTIGTPWLQSFSWKTVKTTPRAGQVRGKGALRQERLEDLLRVGWFGRRIGYYPAPKGVPVRRVVTQADSPLPELEAAGNIVRIYDERWRTVFYHRLDTPAGTPKGVIVMVHGAGAIYSRGAVFASAMNRLGKEGWEVIALDLPFHGDGVRDELLAELDRLMSYVHSICTDAGLRYCCPVVGLGRSFGANLMLEYGSRHPGRLAGVIAMSGYSRESLAFSLVQFERDAAAGLFVPNREGFALATQVERQFTWWDRVPTRRTSLQEATPRQIRYMVWETPYLYLAGKKDPEYPVGAWEYWRARTEQDGSRGFFPDEGAHDLLDSRNRAVFEPTIAQIDAFATAMVSEKRAVDAIARQMALKGYRRL